MPNLSDRNNWQKIYENEESINGKPSRTNSLGIHRIELHERSNYYRIGTSSYHSKHYWWLAGWLTLYVKGETGGYAGVIDNRKIGLNEYTILDVQLEPESFGYHLTFQPAYWLKDIAIIVEVFIDTENI